MAISASTFISKPSTTADKVVAPQGTDINGTLVDWQKQAQYHTEPIFEVDNTEIKAYENYKIADQYTGHAIRSEPTFDLGNNATAYTIEESGEHYMSGKTYYLGSKTVMVPVT